MFEAIHIEDTTTHSEELKECWYIHIGVYWKEEHILKEEEDDEELNYFPREFKFNDKTYKFNAVTCFDFCLTNELPKNYSFQLLDEDLAADIIYEKGEL